MAIPPIVSGFNRYNENSLVLPPVPWLFPPNMKTATAWFVKLGIHLNNSICINMLMLLIYITLCKTFPGGDPYFLIGGSC